MYNYSNPPPKDTRFETLNLTPARVLIFSVLYFLYYIFLYCSFCTIYFCTVFLVLYFLYCIFLYYWYVLCTVFYFLYYVLTFVITLGVCLCVFWDSLFTYLNVQWASSSSMMSICVLKDSNGMCNMYWVLWKTYVVITDVNTVLFFMFYFFCL